MKIGIDVSQIVYGTGVSRYTEELVKNLVRIDSNNQYILFFSSLRQKIFNFQFSIFNKNVIIKNFKLPPTLLDLLWNRWHVVDIENFMGQIDIFHSSDWTQPPAKAKKVTTVHDVSFLRYPESFPQKIIEVHQRRLKWVKKECDRVIVDSRTTKDDLVRLLGFNEKRIRVVYLGVDKLKVQSAKLKVKEGNYFLYIGTLQPRKNLLRLIRAFGEIRDREGVKLVIGGKKGWLYEEIFEEVKRLNLQDKVIFKGFVSEEEKISLMQNALAFVYPSLYEGFGMPVLEAMSAGCPVITSNISSLPEVAGKAALLVNPHKTEEIVSAMKKVMIDSALRRELSEKGRKQANKFTWKKTAQETLKVYQELYDYRD